MQISSLNTAKVPVTKFGSWAEFVEVCTKYAPLAGGSSRKISASWSGTRDWATAVDYARNGEASVTEALSTTVDRLMEYMAPVENPSMYLDMTTEYGWDMGTAITGNPQAGINFQNEASESRKLVRLVLSGNNLANVSANQMFYRGTLAYCLYLTLTQRGYDVTVDLVFSNDGHKQTGKENHTTLVNLVSPGEVLDLAVIAYACTNPSVFRRLYFAYMETIFSSESRDTYSVGWGYGSTVEAPLDMRGDIYLGPKLIGSLQTEADFTALIAHANREIKAFEVYSELLSRG